MSLKVSKVWDGAEDQCGPGTQLTEPFSKFNNFFRLDASCVMVEATEKAFFWKQAHSWYKRFYFHFRTWRQPFFCWISGTFHSPHLISSSQLQDYCFLMKMYGEHVTRTLGCSSSIFTGDLFPCGIDYIQLKNQSIFGLRFFLFFKIIS